MKCNIHTVPIGKRTYFVFCCVKNYRVHNVFVWRKKPEFFWLPEKIDELKAKTKKVDDRIDLIYIDHRGHPVTMEGLNRFSENKPHEQEFNSLLPDLNKAVLFVKQLNKKSLKDFKKCILLIFDK